MSGAMAQGRGRLGGLMGLLGALLVNAVAWAGDSAGPCLLFETKTGSGIQIEGSTNVNRWKCLGNELEARVAVVSSLERLAELLMSLEAQVFEGPIPNGIELPNIPPPTMGLAIPVWELSCGNRAMERDLRELLRAQSHPLIRFQFDELVRAAVEPPEEGRPRRYRLRVLGTLEMAGVSRQVESVAWAERKGAQGLLIAGVMDLSMTWFDIAPPTALLGLIRARDDFVVRYELLLEPRTTLEQAAPSLTGWLPECQGIGDEQRASADR